MKSNGYYLGLNAGKKGLWFHVTLDEYLTNGLLDREEIIDFYKGYWGDLYEVAPYNGRIILINRNQYQCPVNLSIALLISGWLSLLQLPNYV